ncbi:hypothetical protein GGR58DRAFT_502358 [Xylaria digitata]|nr:hypothetical protein GGR58DRAFT_502358 [Xylaria digitata]
MADPISIIGLVSGIITFVDFGLKVVSGTKTVRDSLYGTTAEVNEVDEIVKEVKRCNDLVKQQRLAGQNLSDDEKCILAMVTECDRLVGELRKAINILKIRPDALSKTLESVRVFTQSLYKRDEIQSLRSNLENMARRIQSSVERLMQE